MSLGLDVFSPPVPLESPPLPPATAVAAAWPRSQHATPHAAPSAASAQPSISDLLVIIQRLELQNQRQATALAALTGEVARLTPRGLPLAHSVAAAAAAEGNALTDSQLLSSSVRPGSFPFTLTLTQRDPSGRLQFVPLSFEAAPASGRPTQQQTPSVSFRDLSEPQLSASNAPQPDPITPHSIARLSAQTRSALLRRYAEEFEAEKIAQLDALMPSQPVPRSSLSSRSSRSHSQSQSTKKVTTTPRPAPTPTAKPRKSPTVASEPVARFMQATGSPRSHRGFQRESPRERSPSAKSSKKKSSTPRSHSRSKSKRSRSHKAASSRKQSTPDPSPRRSPSAAPASSKPTRPVSAISARAKSNLTSPHAADRSEFSPSTRASPSSGSTTVSARLSSKKDRSSSSHSSSRAQSTHATDAIRKDGGWTDRPEERKLPLHPAPAPAPSYVRSLSLARARPLTLSVTDSPHATRDSASTSTRAHHASSSIKQSPRPASAAADVAVHDERKESSSHQHASSEARAEPSRSHHHSSISKRHSRSSSGSVLQLADAVAAADPAWWLAHPFGSLALSKNACGVNGCHERKLKGAAWKYCYSHSNPESNSARQQKLRGMQLQSAEQSQAKPHSKKRHSRRASLQSGSL